MTGMHAGVVGALCAVVAAALIHQGVDPALVGYTVGYSVLALVLLQATTLLSLGELPLACALVGSGAIALCLPAVVGPFQGATLAATQVGTALVLLAVAYRAAQNRFTTASAHR
jgi:hypothetical protein